MKKNLVQQECYLEYLHFFFLNNNFKSFGSFESEKLVASWQVFSVLKNLLLIKLKISTLKINTCIMRKYPHYIHSSGSNSLFKKKKIGEDQVNTEPSARETVRISDFRLQVSFKIDVVWKMTEILNSGIFL